MIRRPPRSTRTDTLFPYTTLFRSSMKFRFPALMLAFALGLSGCASAPTLPDHAVDLASADPAPWVVKDEDTTIYLFGTVHVLKPGTLWFDDEVRQAFDTSEKLVLEIIEPDQGEMAGKVAALALDPDGPPLSEKLNESARAKYVSAMAQAGIPWQAFERFKPWMAGITLAISPLGKLGYEAKSEEHTSELQSLMRISYAVFCLKKKNNTD